MIQVNNDCTSRIKTERGHGKTTYMVLLFLEWLCGQMASVRSCLPWLFQEWFTIFHLHSIHEVCPSLEYSSCMGRHHSTFYVQSRIRIERLPWQSRAWTTSTSDHWQVPVQFLQLAGGQYLRSEHRGCRCRCSEVSNIKSSLCQRIVRVS